MSGTGQRRPKSQLALIRVRQLTDLLNYLIPQEPRLDIFVVKTWSRKEQGRLERWCTLEVATVILPRYEPEAIPKKPGRRIGLTPRMLMIRAMNELPVDRMFQQRRA